MDFQHGFTMTIGGLPVAGESSFPVINPATTDCLAQAPEASRAQLDAAVAAARRAFDGWQAVPLAQRQALVHCIAGRLEAHHHAFARLLTSEQGKPLADAHAEVARCIRWLKETACMGLPDEVLLDTPEAWGCPTRCCSTRRRRRWSSATCRWAWSRPSRPGTSR